MGAAVFFFSPYTCPEHGAAGDQEGSSDARCQAVEKRPAPPGKAEFNHTAPQRPGAVTAQPLAITFL